MLMSISAEGDLLTQLEQISFANGTSIADEVRRACTDFLATEVIERVEEHRRDLDQLHTDNRAAVDAYVAGMPVQRREAPPVMVPRSEGDHLATYVIPANDLVMLEQLAHIRGVKVVDLVREACARRTKHEINDNRADFEQKYTDSRTRAFDLIERLVNAAKASETSTSRVPHSPTHPR